MIYIVDFEQRTLDKDSWLYSMTQALGYPVLRNRTEFEGVDEYGNLFLYLNWYDIDRVAECASMVGICHGFLDQPVNPTWYEVNLGTRGEFEIRDAEEFALSTLDYIWSASEYTAQALKASKLGKAFSPVVSVVYYDVPDLSSYVTAEKLPKSICVAQRPHEDKQSALLELFASQHPDYLFHYCIPEKFWNNRDLVSSTSLPNLPNVTLYCCTKPAYYKVLGRCEYMFTTAAFDQISYATMEGFVLGAKVIAPRMFGYPEVYPASNLYEPYSLSDMGRCLSTATPSSYSGTLGFSLTNLHRQVQLERKDA